MPFNLDDPNNTALDYWAVCRAAAASGPQEQVAHNQPNGLVVSTILAAEGWYETAIRDAAGVYPVMERYEDREAALAGHDLWVERAQGKLTKVTKLGYGPMLPSIEVTLTRRH